MWIEDRDSREQQRHYPIQRNYANDAAQCECGRSRMWARHQHDEPADDEEDIYAGGEPVRVEESVVTEQWLIRRDLRLQMQVGHHGRRDGSQILHAEEL